MNPDPINAYWGSDLQRSYQASKKKREEEDKIKETMLNITTLINQSDVEYGHVHYNKLEFGVWQVQIHVKPKGKVRYQITTSDKSLAKALAEANKGLDRYLAEEVSL